MRPSHADLLSRFRSLNVPGDPLLLANVWDAGSAAVAAAGAPALASTSAGVAWAHAVPDGGGLGREQALAAVGRMVTAAGPIPFSADLEGGYGRTSADTAATVVEALRRGAVGVNLEDGPRPAEEWAAHLAAVRDAAEAAGLGVFINARTDVFLSGGASEDELVDEALRRGRLYVEAGADGVFVPGAASASAVGRIVAGLRAPVNVMASPGGPSIAELAGLGVARVSLGSAVAEAAYACAAGATATLLRGELPVEAPGLGYAELNAAFAARA
ncbi:MAG: isocitrate lyase/phosphoenolpyruvate mutase family protein [Arthrobacter sp.]|jgi:2-methylisocitrate lyase-like PEP mutase family enzyme|nr:isocitrate lyase/phosphoenolpyruvate mutase family protein [Arthrobacter sp.]